MNVTRKVANQINPLIADTDYRETLSLVNNVLSHLQDLFVKKRGPEIYEPQLTTGIYYVFESLRAAIQFEYEEATVGARKMKSKRHHQDIQSDLLQALAEDLEWHIRHPDEHLGKSE